ncbi:hypothetical protein SprV_0802537900 [Sparganum proliferum]
MYQPADNCNAASTTTTAPTLATAAPNPRAPQPLITANSIIPATIIAAATKKATFTVPTTNLERSSRSLSHQQLDQQKIFLQRYEHVHKMSS